MLSYVGQPDGLLVGMYDGFTRLAGLYFLLVNGWLSRMFDWLVMLELLDEC